MFTNNNKKFVGDNNAPQWLLFTADLGTQANFSERCERSAF